jgi:peroxiredoxin
MIRKKVPNIIFKTRVGDETLEEGGCAIGGEWTNITTDDYFANKKVVVFSLPGAFTPTCSSQQLPGFEELYNQFKANGVDEVYCISVNDSFVLNAWFQQMNIKNVKAIADGNGEFTKGMGMLTDMSVVGFNTRSRRYTMVVDNGNVIKQFNEPDSTSADPDPYGVSSPETCLKFLGEE